MYTTATAIDLKSNGMAHASEIKLEIRRKNLRFCEVAVQIEYSDYSRQKGQSPLNALNILLDLITRKILP
jgi:polyprenyl-phospho-N-acetylgalactosaminyl synthase